VISSTNALGGGSQSRRSVVTSAEFTRHFGHVRQSSSVEPVFVTHHGRETHVLLAIETYRDLTSGEPQPTSVAQESLPSSSDLAGWILRGCIILDGDERIVFANPTAHAITARDDGALIGRSLFDAVPEFSESLVRSYVNRATSNREPCIADLPSMFRQDGWLRLEVYPTARNTTLLLHDITEDVRRDRLADPKKVLVDTIDRHGDIGTIRLNVRARIEHVNDACATMLGLPRERLVDIAIHDLVPRAARVAFRDVVDPVLAGGAPAQFDTAVLANDGTIVPVRGTISELRGAYGSEGAVIVLTRRSTTPAA
jgi:PAS domain S-box-containing protein